MSAALPAYFDYAATTPVDARVAARMSECLTLDGVFGNPGSASHVYGAAAGALVEAARAEVAAAVGVQPCEVIFTSGATEANNLAVFGVAQHYREQGRHIVTSRIEHKSVLDPCRELERRGWRVSYLTPDRDGWIEPAQVAAALRPDTVLVSIMHVNNEIGVVQDVAAIAAACAGHPLARLHVDAAQSLGKQALDAGGAGIDLVSLSAHKAYGPKGAGALIVARRRGVQLQPLHWGGGQERTLRSGTLATHQVVGMGAAFALASAQRAGETARIGRLRERLWRGLDALGGVLRNGDAARTVAQILNVSIEDVEGESLLADLRSSVAVSTGSACTSAVQEPSYVLRALGRDERLAESSLRFSMGRYSTETEVQTAVSAVARAVARLRRIAGRAAADSAAAGGLPATDARAPPPGTHYSNLTWQHFAAPLAAGELSGPTVRRGSAGSRAAGVWVQFDVDCGVEAASAIRAVRFRAFGCPHVIAVCDWVARAAVGRAAVPVLAESIKWLREHFAVPVEKMGRLVIIEDAWIAALSPPP